jgi:hypothetical protein
MRKLYTEKRNETFVPIDPKEIDFRSKRITAYLNLIKKSVDEQFEDLKKQAFDEGTDLNSYLKLSPDNCYRSGNNFPSFCFGINDIIISPHWKI